MSETKRQEQYEGAVVQIGNSQVVRFPSGFFKAHPVFKGKVRLTVVADGEVLVSVHARVAFSASSGGVAGAMARK